jgi:hypothetical protein
MCWNGAVEGGDEWVIKPRLPGQGQRRLDVAAREKQMRVFDSLGYAAIDTDLNILAPHKKIAPAEAEFGASPIGVARRERAGVDPLVESWGWPAFQTKKRRRPQMTARRRLRVYS